MDREQEGFFQHYFTVIVRDPNVDVAHDRCLQIGNALKAEHRTVDDVHFISMFPQQRPTPYPRGSADLIEVACQIHCAFAEL